MNTDFIFILCWICVLVVTMLLVKTITGITFHDAFSDFTSTFRSKEQDTTYKLHKQITEKQALMSSEERKKNKLYRYYSLLNDIILSFGWRNVTVEGFTVGCLLASIFISIAYIILARNIILTVIVQIISFVVIICVLYSLSRSGYRKRRVVLMDAMNVISSSISMGFAASVENNLSRFDKSLQPVFKMFLDEYNLQNVDFVRAIRNLNRRLGSIYDVFCDNVIAYTLNYKPGMEIIFKQMVINNNNLSTFDKECESAFSSMNNDFLLSISICFVFIFGSYQAVEKVKQFYGSPLGVIVLSFYFIIAGALFIYLQTLDAKDFKR